MSIDKWRILQVAGRLVKYAQLSALSDKFGFGYVSPPPEDPEQGDEPTQQRVRMMQWFGFRSRPVASGGEAVVVAPRGGTTNAVVVAADHMGYGPTDLAEGEVAVYDRSGSVIRLHTNGDVTVIPKAGAKVKLGDFVDANLDLVVLYTKLKTEFDAFVTHYNQHTHVPTGVLFDSLGGLCTGSVLATPDQASPLTSAVGSSNVAVKK